MLIESKKRINDTKLQDKRVPEKKPSAGWSELLVQEYEDEKTCCLRHCCLRHCF